MSEGGRRPVIATALRLVRFGAWGVLALACAGCVLWALFQSADRLPDYPEGCVLFNAARIREGLPLYVDPLVGAGEYAVGPPARYFVAYTPFYAAALAAVPASGALVFARIFGLVCWSAALAYPVATARGPRRRIAMLAAAFAGSTYLYARWSACVKPDALALLLLAVGLARCLEKDGLDAKAALLLALGAVIKPSVVGAVSGTTALTLFLALRKTGWQERKQRLLGPLAGGLTVLATLGVLQLVSHGQAIFQLRAALGLAFELDRFVDNNLSRAPFVLAVVAPAFVAAVRHRREPRGALALAALVGSTVTAAIGLGKIGAASNYLMEPVLVSVVVLSRVPFEWPTSRALGAALVGAIALSFAWVEVATARSLRDGFADLGRSRRELAEVRELCFAGHPRGFALAADPGLELALDGRIYTHVIELWNASLHGRYPEAVWAADIGHPDVRCFVVETGDAEPPKVAAALVPIAVLGAMDARFGPPVRRGRFAVYMAR